MTETAVAIEEMYEELQSWLGKDLRIELGNTEACHDNIRWFALGMGDPNPLWLDLDYGRGSVFGTNVAPPTFLYSVYFAPIVPGLPQTPRVHLGDKWTFHDRVRLGDQGLRAEAKMVKADLVTSGSGVTRIHHSGLARYFRRERSGEETCVAEAEPSFFRMAPPSGDKKGLRYEPREPAVWSEGELMAIAAEVHAETRRGAEPRYWEDVAVGESIGSLLRGPYSEMDQLCYNVGERGKGRRAFDGWWLHLDDDPESQRNDNIRPRVSGHWTSAVAHKMGMPGVYDDGHQRVSVVGSLVTSWMGDLGFLRELSVRQNKPVILGDLVRFTGVVEQVNPDAEGRPAPDGSPTRSVDLRLEGRNQLDQVVSSGSAIVELPSRSAKPS